LTPLLCGEQCLQQLLAPSQKHVVTVRQHVTPVAR